MTEGIADGGAEADSDLKGKLKRAQLALTHHKVRQASAGASMAELRTQQAWREEQHIRVTDDLVREHAFIGPVNGNTVQLAVTHLAFWHRLDPECPMNVQIHSQGGEVLAGLHLFDQMTAYSKRGGGQHQLTITVRGLAASMAGVLVQAADERVIGPESYLMVHELSAAAIGKMGEMDDALEFYRRLNNRLASIYVERSGGKCSMEKFKELWTRKDAWLDARQALELGFVDRIG